MKPHIDFDRVDQLGPQHQHAELTLSASQLSREELPAGVEVNIDLTTQKGEREGEYLVDGNIRYEGELFCSRCLEPFPFENATTFSLVYRPRPAEFGTPEAEIEIADQDLDLDYYDERSVFLETIAQEQVQLSLPMKPLCEEACQGLCPQCGANLSGGACTCTETTADSRWDSLREFREQMAKKKEN